MGVETRHIEFNYDPNYPVDVEIILGDDWVSKENLP
jgi:hypothetical protein